MLLPLVQTSSLLLLAPLSSFAFVTFRQFDRNSVSSSTKRMAIQGAGYGASSAESTDVAVAEALSTAMGSLDGTTPAMAFLSATVRRDIEEVRKAFVQQLSSSSASAPTILMHGITSSGALLEPGDGSLADSVGCLLLSSDSSTGEDFAAVFDASGDGASAAAALKERTGSCPPQAIFMGATPGAEESILESISQEFPGIPVFGGTAADDELNGSWKVWSADESSGQGVSLVGIGPNVKFGASMVGPYTPTSRTCMATKAEGRRVFEIDGKPAVDWVYEWLGDEVKDQYENGGLVLPQTAQRPIARKAGGANAENDEFVTAHCAAFSGGSKEESYVEFFGPIPEGSTLTIMDSGNGPDTGYASALSNAFDIAQSNLELNDEAAIKAGLLVYCGGMAIAVGDNLNAGLTNEEFAAKAGGLPILGMTCFGEQAYLPISRKNVQRNLSVGMVLFA